MCIRNWNFDYYMLSIQLIFSLAPNKQISYTKRVPIIRETRHSFFCILTVKLDVNNSAKMLACTPKVNPLGKIRGGYFASNRVFGQNASLA
jgi:hypothetical protein